MPTARQRVRDHPSAAAAPRRRRRVILIAVPLVLLGGLAVAGIRSYERYTSVYDATYIGSQACGACHSQVHRAWHDSPHALMVRRPSAASVVGDFEQGSWTIPHSQRRGPDDARPAARPAARMLSDGSTWTMSLREPDSERYREFRVDYVVGYQYRQVYLHEEPGGVLRRLPLQWSVERGEFFPYWNFQEGSAPSLRDLWDQMRSQNSAWNLFCARCHVTHLEILDKAPDHTTARAAWAEVGIGCEACHGPGSQHAEYFAGNYVNRVAAFLNSKVRGEPVAYIATATKMDRGRDLSVCARCHGPDIMMVSTDDYRRYEPGYGGRGRVNDLSAHFREFPLQPGRRDPTVECWDDGRPKGIGMLFRSFIESACYDGAPDAPGAGVRCYDCHDPHANRLPVRAGLLEAGPASDAYCLGCHDLGGEVAAHTHHAAGTSGSFCYDCHMPRTIQNLVGGYERFTRTHDMSSIPDPAATVEHGAGGAPNACNGCHDDRTAEWALEWMERWW